MRKFSLIIVALLLNLFAGGAGAQQSVVGGTRHNLSTSGSGVIKAPSGTAGTGTSQICVFCHTPHNSDPAAPGWNRALSSGSNYVVFESSSMQATVFQPDGSSRLCLSCHDGTIALGEVLNRPGAGLTGSSLQLQGPGKLTPDGRLLPSLSGGTSYLGTDLTNDHPVSFLYDQQLAINDGELIDPSPAAGQLTLKLSDGKVQCTTCHDPHDNTLGMFMRVPMKQASDTAVSGTDAQICILCHDKKESPSGINYNWIGSTHQSSATASAQYKVGNYLGKSGAVWEDACLSCHETHAVQGSRRLLLEGTYSPADVPGARKKGGESAMEETCYLCHTNAADSILDASSNLKDIESEFNKLYHMPITTMDQADKLAEAHDIKDANLEEVTTEDYPLLGKTPNLDVSKRHVECSDCHNPHRVVKRTTANPVGGLPGQGTHEHMINAGPHTNAASGVLAGAWGVDPFESAALLPGWEEWPLGVDYQQKGTISSGVLTREYQICLKCHSSYAFGQLPPQQGTTGGSTPYGENGVVEYTDQAKEFNPGNNGFHPVIGATGRTMALRNITVSPFLYPWGSGVNSVNIGSQTMYCSDCHGGETPPLANYPVAGSSWGPHGSANKFQLMGTWDYNTGTPSEPGLTAGAPQGLCFKCHDVTVYSPPGGVGGKGPEYTGFSNRASLLPRNLHAVHSASYLTGLFDVWESQNGVLAGGQTYEISCMTCHVGMIHGFSGANPKKGYMLLASITAKLSACTVANDPDLCIDPLLSDEIPYRTERTRLRSEDRDGAGWGTSGNWTAANCAAAHYGSGSIAGGCRAP